MRSRCSPRRSEPLIRIDGGSARRGYARGLSTAKGGGVAEMLGTLLGYARGVGVDWVVISGDSEFFAITKRIHNGLYGSPGDGGALGAAERAHYDRITTENAERLRRIVRSGDACSSTTRSRAGLLVVGSALVTTARCTWTRSGSNAGLPSCFPVVQVASPRS